MIDLLIGVAIFGVVGGVSACLAVALVLAPDDEMEFIETARCRVISFIVLVLVAAFFLTLSNSYNDRIIVIREAEAAVELAEQVAEHLGIFDSE